LQETKGKERIEKLTGEQMSPLDKSEQGREKLPLFTRFFSCKISNTEKSSMRNFSSYSSSSSGECCVFFSARGSERASLALSGRDEASAVLEKTTIPPIPP
jgi:hypothetical protein